MTREEHLEFCRICMKRKMNAKIGLVCGLTNEHADFEDTCKDFQEDIVEAQHMLVRDLDASGSESGHSSLNYRTNLNLGLTIVLICGAALLVIFAQDLDVPSIIYKALIALGLYGLYTLYRGIEQKLVLIKRMELEEKMQKERSNKD